jgi:hypothetical protein
VHSAVFRDLNGNGRQEIIVGWQVAGLRSLSVYTIEEDNSLAEVFSRPFSGYALYDIEDTGVPALLLIHADPEGSRVEMVSARDDEYTVVSTAFLSVGAEALRRIRTGPLLDGRPALYIASQFQSAAGGEVTDVFTFQDGNLVNISARFDSGISDRLVRQEGIFATDINGDGVLDLPSPVELPFHPDAADSFYEIHWGAYDSGGLFTHTARTYHNLRDNWYLLLPEQWLPADRYTVRRDNISASQSVTVFSVFGDTPLDFLKIYHNNQPAASRAPVRNRAILAEQDNFLVSAEIIETEEQKISEDELKSMFNLIPVDWRAP